MATWTEFERAAPEMAALGMKQFQKFGLAYLATTRKDGAPRVHPVCPVIAGGRLFVATAPTFAEEARPAAGRSLRPPRAARQGRGGIPRARHAHVA